MPRARSSKTAILDEAVDLASVVGLGGLTIGALAEHTGYSKSGLFAHFGSKQALQLETLKAGADRFRERVVKPALAAPRGEARVRALLEAWLEWSARSGAPGGCLFVTASTELDDGDGPVRDFLVSSQRDWLYAIARTAELAVEAGDFRADLDSRQFAFDLHAIYLGFHHARRLLRDSLAESRARDAFERLVTAAKPARSAG